MSKLPLSLLVASAAMLSCEAFAATYGAAFYPNDPLFPYNSKQNPGFPGQWHLENKAPKSPPGSNAVGNVGLDVNIVGAWAMGVTGAGVIIGIVDDGVEGTHEDLAPGYRADLSKNFSQNAELAARPQAPVQSDDNHGTSVAGVAAARGGNGIGVTGASPYAQIAAMRLHFGDSSGDPAATTADIANAFLWQTGVNASGQYENEAVVSVKNNSWGSTAPMAGTIFNKSAADYKAMASASANNVIFVYAAGNERAGSSSYNQQAQGDSLTSSDLSIQVAALGSDGVYSSYSNFGCSVFVTAPSNSATGFGITTTDRMGPSYGYNTYDATNPSSTLSDLSNPNYTSTFGGTSSASPLVAGIIALGKQVTPAMDVRLAKQALALTSRVVDANDKSISSGGRGWVTNAAGYSFNPNYGFGLIDATAFVQKVIDSAYLTDRTTATASSTSSKVVQFGAASGVTQSFTISSALANQPIESVEFRIKMTGPDLWEHLHIAGTSPSGTITDLWLFNDYLNNVAGTPEQKAAFEAAMNLRLPSFDWVFTANNFWGENAAGTWTIQAWNRGSSNITWDSYTATINMGKMVMESGNMVISTDVKATSLNLDKSSTYFKIENARTFTVTDSVTLNAGTVDVYGSLAEGSPNSNPTFFKGNQITVAKGAQVVVRDGGSVAATRGVILNGGTFSNSGTFTTTAGIEINNGGTFATTKDLAFSGSLVVSNGTFTGSGSLTASKGITLGAGSIIAPTQITTGELTISGGTLKTATLNAGGKILFNGGALDVSGNISASEFQINGGLYSPGGVSKISTSTVFGNVSIATGGTFIVDVKNSATGGGANVVAADLLHVSGTVTLGGTFVVNRLTSVGTKPGDQLTFITSDTGITGDFETNAAAVTPTLHYIVSISPDGKNAVGTATRDYNFAGINLTPNQRVVGTTFNNLLASGGTDPSFDYNANIFTPLDSIQTDKDLRTVYDQLSPLNSVMLGQSIVQQANAQTGAMRSRARDARTSFIQPGSIWTNFLFEDSYGFNYSAKPVLVASTGSGFIPFQGYDDASPMTLWINGGGSFSSGKNSDYTSGYDSYGYNGTIGLDYRFSDELLIGILGGYSGTQTDFNTSGMENSNGSALVALYAAGQKKGWYYNAMAGYGMDNYSLKRTVGLPDMPGPLDGSYKGNPHGDTVLGYLGIGYEWMSENWSFGPTASIQYIHSNVDGYTENGTGWQALTVDEQKIESLTSSLGWRVSKVFNFQSVSILPEIRASWIHEFKDNSRDITSVMSIPGANRFTIQGVKPTSNYGNIGLSLSMMLSKQTSLSLEYDCYMFIDNVDPTHQASATLRVYF